MSRITVENAWVEFPVQIRRGSAGDASPTGGVIDADRGVVTALRDISVELREGDRLGLVGHNGAGKTTLLRMLCGAYPPTRGRVISQGSISTLFNTTPGLDPDGTGRENLVTCGLHLGLSRRQIKAKMGEIIDFAELGDFIDLPVRIYSAGMRTRLGFSIATAIEPEILLLDEGLATGDARFSHKAQQKIKDLITRSSILVIASHSEALLSKTCNRCLLLEHGRIVADGPTETLITSYRTSVIEAARADDAEGLRRAYVMATEMASRGEQVPLELREHSLRHALTIAPNDAMMWQRYVDVLTKQGKPVPPEVEAQMLLVTINSSVEPRPKLILKLRKILENSPEGLSDLQREQARIAIETAATPQGEPEGEMIGRG